MAKRKWKPPISVMIEDSAQDVPEQRDPHTGTILRHFTKGVRLVAPGEEIMLEEAEIARIEARWGTWAEAEANKRALIESRRRVREGGQVHQMI